MDERNKTWREKYILQSSEGKQKSYFVGFDEKAKKLNELTDEERNKFEKNIYESIRHNFKGLSKSQEDAICARVIRNILNKEKETEIAEESIGKEPGE